MAILGNTCLSQKFEQLVRALVVSIILSPKHITQDFSHCIDALQAGKVGFQFITIFVFKKKGWLYLKVQEYEHVLLY